MTKTDATATFAAVDGLNAALAAVTNQPTAPAAPKADKPKAAAKPKPDAAKLEAAATAAPSQPQTARAKRAAATGLKDGDQEILDLLATGKSKAAVAKELNVKAYAVNAAVERKTFGRLRRPSDLTSKDAA